MMLARRSSTLTPEQEELLDLRDRVAEQAERIAELEEELRQRDEAYAPPVAFPATWKLTPQESALLSALYASRAPYVTRQGLFTRISGPESDAQEKLIDVVASKVRTKLKPIGLTVETRHGEGYYLLPKARRVLAEVLGDVPAPVAPPPGVVVHPRGWSEAEEAIVRAGYERGAKLTVIRVDLQAAGFRARAPSAISQRAQQLGLTSEHAFTRWTPAQDAIVREAYEAGLPHAQIRLRLAEAGAVRNRSAIAMRLTALGIACARTRLWSDSEDRILRAGLAVGLPYTEIRDRLRAAGYDRGSTAVHKRARTLGAVRRADPAWSAQDDATLRRLYDAKTSLREIARALGRPVGGVSSRASKIGLLQRVRWSAEERRRLIAASEAGRSLADVAAEIGRPYPNVTAEASRLRVSFGRKRQAALAAGEGTR